MDEFVGPAVSVEEALEEALGLAVVRCPHLLERILQLAREALREAADDRNQYD